MRELRNISRERLAKKSKVKLHLLIRIEEGAIDGRGFGLKEICGLAAGMGITPGRVGEDSATGGAKTRLESATLNALIAAAS